MRHILPLYPFFLMISAAGAMEMARRAAGRLALGGLTVVWIAVLASVYPHTLTFFNRFVGGPQNGYKYLADSNVDWGQGLKLLKKWMDQRGVSHIALAYYGTADPAYYGINYTALPAARPAFQLPSIDRKWTKPALPGFVAVSATVLTGVYLDPEWMTFYRGLRNTTPLEVIGNSIFVYRLDRWPEERPPSAPTTPRHAEADLRLGNELLKGQWFEHATFHYRQYLETGPLNETAGLVGLGMSLASSGAVAEAIAALRRAVGREPDNGSAQFALAASLFEARADIDEVVAHARRAAALLPRNVAALTLLSRSLAVRGLYDEAAAVVQRALDIDPDDADARKLQGLIRSAADTNRSS